MYPTVCWIVIVIYQIRWNFSIPAVRGNWLTYRVSVVEVERSLGSSMRIDGLSEDDWTRKVYYSVALGGLS